MSDRVYQVRTCAAEDVSDRGGRRCRCDELRGSCDALLAAVGGGRRLALTARAGTRIRVTANQTVPAARRFRLASARCPPSSSGSAHQRRQRSIVSASHASAHHTIPDGYRAPTRRYLAEIARAADRLSFEGVLTPTGTWCEDVADRPRRCWPRPERLKFLVAFRPGPGTPTLAAQQTATLQQFSEAECCSISSAAATIWEQQRFGDWLSHDERYSRTAEFPRSSTGSGVRSVDFSGAHYTVKDARVSEPPNPLPADLLRGSSAAALPIAAEHVDVYLTWGTARGRGQDRRGPRTG